MELGPGWVSVLVFLFLSHALTLLYASAQPSHCGAQLLSHLPPRLSCLPSPSLEILEEWQQAHMCYSTTLDLAVHPAPSSPEACSSHSLPQFSNHTIIYPAIQAESLGIILHFPFPQPPHLIH